VRDSPEAAACTAAFDERQLLVDKQAAVISWQVRVLMLRNGEKGRKREASRHLPKSDDVAGRPI